jgi:RimJ/RimL family protein N-acetyltransferase
MIEDIRLRPVTEEDLPLLDALYNGSPESGVAFDWFGFSGSAGKRRTWAENGLLTADSGTLIVVHEDEPVGFVGWRSVPFGPLNRGWNIGIGLLTQARGHGIGTRAQVLLARYLFAHTEVHRIDAQTDVENIAEQRALEKAGFTSEGIMRGAQFRNGRYHDMASYSMLRHDIGLD